ncbi:MAG TPA: hypothetical protein PLU02_16540, partial [Chitinophagales bacterium]|nr:hypothetical protein [Chitinophagales bacterium]
NPPSKKPTHLPTSFKKSAQIRLTRSIRVPFQHPTKKSAPVCRQAGQSVQSVSSAPVCRQAGSFSPHHTKKSAPIRLTRSIRVPFHHTSKKIRSNPFNPFNLCSFSPHPTKKSAPVCRQAGQSATSAPRPAGSVFLFLIFHSNIVFLKKN